MRAVNGKHLVLDSVIRKVLGNRHFLCIVRRYDIYAVLGEFLDDIVVILLVHLDCLLEDVKAVVLQLDDDVDLLVIAE